MSKFKIGQKIRLIDPSTISNGNLRILPEDLKRFVGQELTVSHASTEHEAGYQVSFVEDTKYGHWPNGAWNAGRFELVPVTAKVNDPAPNKAAAPAVARF